MTRWARGGHLNKKKELSATPWAKLSGSAHGAAAPNAQDDGRSAQSNFQKVKTRNRNVATEREAESNSAKKQSAKTKAVKRKRSGLLDTLYPLEESNDQDPDERSDDSDAEQELGVAGTLEKLQPKVKVKDDVVADFVKKEERREKRRLKRIDQRQSETVCYNCRKKGHEISNCPRLQQDSSQGTGICFKCGSTEHSINRCHVKLPPGVFPYAKCFICRETGHLSKQCPDNPRGLYPNGGCCKWCGSVEHFKRDCPELKKKQGIEDLKLDKWAPGSKRSVDADEYIVQKPPSKRQKLKKKIVKF